MKISTGQEVLTNDDIANGLSTLADDRHNITLLEWGKPVAWFSAIVPGELIREFLEVMKAQGHRRFDFSSS